MSPTQGRGGAVPITPVTPTDRDPRQSGPRSYRILVGTGALPRWARELAKLSRRPARRPRHRRDHPAAPRRTGDAGPRAAGFEVTEVLVPEGEEAKTLAVREVWDALLDAGCDRSSTVVAARRRRRRRPRRLRRRHLHARDQFRPGAHHAARPGRRLHRRQDRHRSPARQEPHRRLPPAPVRPGRPRGARDPARAGLSLGARRGDQARHRARRRRTSRISSEAFPRCSPATWPCSSASSPARAGSRPRWSSGTSGRPSCGTSSTTATRSATPSRRRPATTAGPTARPSRSAWWPRPGWPSASASPPRRRPRGRSRCSGRWGSR